MIKLLSTTLIFGICIFAFAACSFEQPEDNENIVVLEYPKAIDDYVEKNYSPLLILEVSIHDEEEYEVYLNDNPNTVLIFDLVGNFLEEE